MGSLCCADCESFHNLMVILDTYAPNAACGMHRMKTLRIEKDER